MCLSQIRQSICTFLCGSQDIEAPPKIPRYVISASEVSKELEAAGIHTLYGRLDSLYIYTDVVSWEKIMMYIYKNMQLPDYCVDNVGRWNLDCEDFAIWMKSMVSTNFGINYIGIAIGDTPQGRHSFNIIRDENKLMVYEPQPGYGINYPFDLDDEHQYHVLDALL